MAESFELPKKVIMQSFISFSFPSGQSISEKDLLDISQGILQSFGIPIQDFPYAISEFFVKGWYINLLNHKILPNLVEEMLEMIEIAMLSKYLVFQYLSFLKQTLNNYLSEIIFYGDIESSLISYVNSVKENHRLYRRVNGEMLNRHHRLIFEDNFAIILAFTCLNESIESVKRISPTLFLYFENFVDYIKKLLDSGINKLFDKDRPDYIKVFIRGWMIKDLNHLNHLNNYMIETVENEPLISIPECHFDLFEQVIHSSVVSKAIDLFVKDTLMKENSPFENEEDGKKMIYEGFNWVSKSGNTFYANLNNFAHGYSSDGYVYIHRNYEKKESYFSPIFRLLTLLHESFQIYKRLGDNKNKKINSPENSLVGIEEKQKPEDGIRFENFLIPNKGKKLYLNGAVFLSDLRNWNLDILEFQKMFLEEQSLGNKMNQPSQNFSIKSSGMDWPKCLRILV
ncbi:hypothetical protein SteCoe_36918 [Stentor coeruleus]|uniref:Uncharacterized protein n=1 Tax=Stentor coeruleus TaxID=5963 RepID=A0A1R2AP46_9CILI|nr:hypothetical protein SteCoe_36918 [Stentor coeruleus]